MIDLDAWEERAAILEFDEQMTRFAAETEAARRLGCRRFEAINAKRDRDSERARDRREAVARDHANDMPEVQRGPEEQDRPLPQRDVPAGRNRMEMLALPVSGGAVL